MLPLFTQTDLLRSLALLLMLGSVAGIVVGVLLLWRPEWLEWLGKHADRWVSTRQMGRSLQRQMNLDHWFYRHSRQSGGAMLLAALYIIYMLFAHFNRAELLAGLAKMQLLQPVLLETLLDTLVLFFLAGTLLAVLVSLFLIFRPSMLRDMELGANQPVSLRQALKPMEIQRGNLDGLVLRHAQKAGVLLLFGSLYTLLGLMYWLTG